jgi:hypothetical protein
MQKFEYKFDSLPYIYNKRGTAEQWTKEGKRAVKITRLSCHRFRSNEVRPWLSVMAYNLGNLWRRLVLPKKIENRSLTSLQQRLVKTGGRLVKHARYLTDACREPSHESSSVRWCVALRRYPRLTLGQSVGCRIQQKRRKKGEVSMELAVGVELASLGCLAAVRKCSRLSGQRLSDLKTYNSGSRKGPSVHTERAGRSDNGNPG